jgi:hypothetical protein
VPLKSSNNNEIRISQVDLARKPLYFRFVWRLQIITWMMILLADDCVTLCIVTEQLCTVVHITLYAVNWVRKLYSITLIRNEQHTSHLMNSTQWNKFEIKVRGLKYNEIFR